MKPDFKEDLLGNTLTINERVELETLEGIISREMKSFMDVGKALLTIRERKLYRGEFKTFKAYCAEKWGMSKDHGNRLIQGFQVAANLGEPISQEPYKTSRGILCTPCEIQPTSEYQIRPLAPLQPEQQCEVWDEAVRTADGKVVTYKLVKALVTKLVGPAPPRPPKKKDPHPESDAIYFVTLAMAHLDSIRDDDPKLEEALNEVIDWINKKTKLLKGEV